MDKDDDNNNINNPPPPTPHSFGFQETLPAGAVRCAPRPIPLSASRHGPGDRDFFVPCV